MGVRRTMWQRAEGEMPLSREGASPWVWGADMMYRFDSMDVEMDIGCLNRPK